MQELQTFRSVKPQGEAAFSVDLASLDSSIASAMPLARLYAVGPSAPVSFNLVWNERR